MEKRQEKNKLNKNTRKKGIHLSIEKANTQHILLLHSVAQT